MIGVISGVGCLPIRILFMLRNVSSNLLWLTPSTKPRRGPRQYGNPFLFSPIEGCGLVFNGWPQRHLVTQSRIALILLMVSSGPLFLSCLSTHISQ